MKTLFCWLVIWCLGLVATHAAPPHPTQVKVIYKDQPWPIIHLTKVDPIVLMDGREKRIRQRVTYYPERAQAFGPGYVNVSLESLSAQPNTFTRVDLGAGIVNINMTLESATDLRGGFMLVSATKPQKEHERGRWPETYFLAHELPDLKAGIATVVEQRLVLMDAEIGMNCFIQLFDAQGREIPTNVMQSAWDYYHEQEIRQLQSALPEYLKKYAGQSRGAFPVVRPTPYLTNKGTLLPPNARALLTVSPHGRVTMVALEGISDKTIAGEIREALRGWLFFPRLSEGEPIETQIEVPLQF